MNATAGGGVAAWWHRTVARLRGTAGAPMAPDTAATGSWGEAVAERVLRDKGFRVLGRRVRVGDRDEIDLVARDGATLVFVEVKTRRSEDFGRPGMAVDRKKQHVLSRAAVRYIRKLKNRRICFRFDVVEVIGAVGDPAPAVRHIPNAFPLDRRYALPC
jgi:putative endonuclease